jgi:hypothetical protein
VLKIEGVEIVAAEGGVDLIYCGGGNKRFAQIALAHGFLYGSRSDDTPCFPVDFVDLDYQAGRQAWPNHRAFVREHRPQYAVAPDLMDVNDFSDIMREAEKLSQWAEHVIVVPKVHHSVQLIAEEYVIGYSVPTSYGGTELWVGEFVGRRVHLLGGSPTQQARIWQYLSSHVVSVDGNVSMKLATRFCQYFDPSRSVQNANNKWWPTIKEADGQRWPHEGAPYEAFRRSCQNLMRFWQGFLGERAREQSGR